MRSRLVFLAILAGSLLSFGGLRAQSFPFVHEVPQPLTGPFDTFFAAADVGDVDGDDRADYVVLESTLAAFNSGTRFQLISGASGQFIRTVTSALGLNPAASSVSGLTGLGDMNGDGKAEIAYARRLIIFSATDLFLSLQDGASGSELWTISLLPTPQTGTVRAIERMGDLNGDGIDDLAVLVRGLSLPPTPAPSFVSFRSGADGALLFDLFDFDELVDDIANVGDTDGDGFDDLVLGAPRSPFAAPEAGGAALVSGANFQYLRFWNGDAPFDHFASGVAPAGDVNQDGFADIMIAAAVDDVVRVYSGLDNSVLATHPLGVQGAYESRLVHRSAFDYDGDGVEDRLFRTTSGTTPTQQRIRSGVDFSILAETDDAVLRDVNGDELPELVEVQIGSLQAAQIPQPTSVRVFAHKGAQTYGIGSGGPTLTWEPDATAPEAGDFTLSGGTPNASVLIAGSTVPLSSTIIGTNFPLLISPDPTTLFLQFNATLDAQGELRAPVSLTQPLIAGAVLYYQWAELSPNPGTSNGLQLLFDN